MSILALSAAMLVVAAKGADDDVKKYPKQLVFDVEYAREMCRAVNKYFAFKSQYVTEMDMNGDGVVDYLLDTNGFHCSNMQEALYGSRNGMPLYLYLSTTPGNWKKKFNANVFEYRVKPVYGELPYLDVWVRGEAGYQINFLRHQWNGKELELIEQDSVSEVPSQLWKNFD